MAKYQCPYTYPHRTRKAKADYICGIGGYYRHNDGNWPIEFNVGAWNVDFSFDHIWGKYAAEYWPFDVAKESPATTKAYFDLALRLHKEHENRMWAWGQEDAYRSLHDDDTYRSLWDGTMLDVKLSLHGRGCKHLVITEFEGHTLSGLDSEDLYQQLMSQHDGSWMSTGSGAVYECGTLRKGNVWSFWSTEDLNKLYKYVRQCEVCFTPDRASEEVECLGVAWFFSNVVNPEWESVKEDMATHDEAVEAAKEVRAAIDALQLGWPSTPRDEELDNAFALLCAAAGIMPEELE